MNDNMMYYTLSKALNEVDDAYSKKLPSITLYGIRPNCAEQVVELSSEKKISLTIFVNQSSPCANFSFTS